MNKKEFRDLWISDELEEVHEELDNAYRHGVYAYTVFKSPDGTYWASSYTISGNGEEHGIRDNDFTLDEVVPVTKTVTITEYIPKEK